MFYVIDTSLRNSSMCELRHPLSLTFLSYHLAPLRATSPRSGLLPMFKSFGASVLSAFDMWEDEKEFLSQLVESPGTPADERQRLVDTSILAHSDDFQHLVNCAKAIQKSKVLPCDNLGGNDVLTFVWHILSNRPHASVVQPAPWAETDRLIQVAKELANKDPYIRVPSASSSKIFVNSAKKPHGQRRSVKRNAVSHYWCTDPATLEAASKSRERLKDGGPRQIDGEHGAVIADAELYREFRDHHFSATSGSTNTSSSQNGELVYPEGQSTTNIASKTHFKEQSSPYFFAAQVADKRFSKRPPAGLVSSVPFPPLFSPEFGLVQERMAHEPFWLLVAVTFLIKTKGQIAIPVFFKVKETFSTPEKLRDPKNAEALFNMIRHLGLASSRVSVIQKYADAFISNPPAPGKLYRVRNYERRDSPALATSNRGLGMDDDADLPTMNGDADADAEAWEIGHMTQGKYTLDSWRIFCRDELLGRAEDWNGKGQQPEFQPEWMRVVPKDKELRAYLRWMWMREGWEWDPESGERRVLRQELQAAVNEGRVEYDNAGGLRILEIAEQDM